MTDTPDRLLTPEDRRYMELAALAEEARQTLRDEECPLCGVALVDHYEDRPGPDGRLPWRPCR